MRRRVATVTLRNYLHESISGYIKYAHFMKNQTTMSGTPHTKRQRVEAKERAILDAAREVFDESGYDGARIAEIARRIGIAEGTVYLYYQNKNALTHALVADLWEGLTLGAREAVHRDAPTLEQLRALAQFHLSTIVDRFNLIELTLRVRSDKSTHAASREQRRVYVAVLDEILQRGIDRCELAATTPIRVCRDMFYGTLEYAARTQLLNSGNAGENALEQIVEHLIHMLGSAYATPSQTAQAPRDVTPASLTKLVVRLENAVTRAENLPRR